jgi:hypothetical protein
VAACEKAIRVLALNHAAARPLHIAGTAWSTKRYLNIELLKDQYMRGAITAQPKPNVRDSGHCRP